MASADLRYELECSVCLNVYTDPVMLKCGHNYCRICIDHVLDKQETCGGYSCPECREEFQDRPELQRNITLRNIVENFLSTSLNQEVFGVFCSYCIHTSVPAVKSCTHCEASLCDNHIAVHSKSPEHVLCDPTTSLKSRKCPVHKKILEYYCSVDDFCVCVSCCLVGEHKGHHITSLDGASEGKKKKLRNHLLKLTSEEKEIENRVLSLQKHRIKVEEKVNDESKSIKAMFTEIRRRLGVLEERILSEVSRQGEQVLQMVNELIQRLESQKDNLSSRICHIQELCNIGDPLTVLQELDTDRLCGFGDDGDREKRNKLLHDDGWKLNMAGLLHTIHTGLSDIVTETKLCCSMDEPTDLSLDIATACNKLHISDDWKTATCLPTQNRPETQIRFKIYPQVISRQSFSSGRHYWEVNVGGSQWWRVGLCYPTIDRTGVQSWIGYNQKSWGLYRVNDQFSVIHDSEEVQLYDRTSSDRVRIYLDYEAGRISFWTMCDTIRHLYTFTTIFTEPIHAAFGVWKGCIKLSRERLETQR